jgi:hypothetical protein
MDHHFSYPTVREIVHVRALDRHAAWARDFAAAGDLDAALDELCDIRALATELDITGTGPAGPSRARGA